MGVRKLYHELQAQMTTLGLKWGRDTLFDLLREHELLVPVKRNRRRTTFGGNRHFPNLIADLKVTHIHQVWVADITYLSTEAGFLYLALLTDVFSRFIVGFDLSASLTADGTLRALRRAGKFARVDVVKRAGLIHHSDHGMQYRINADSRGKGQVPPCSTKTCKRKLANSRKPKARLIMPRMARFVPSTKPCVMPSSK